MRQHNDAHRYVLAEVRSDVQPSADFGDFRRVPRMGAVLQYQASNWCHKEVESAARDLLQHPDRSSG